MTRRMVFENVANGVPIEQIMVALKLSQLEVDQARRFVANKITQRLVAERRAPLPCHDVGAIRFNRRDLLGVLSRIGNLDLSSEILVLTYKDGSSTTFGTKIMVQDLDHPEMIEGAKHLMAEHRAEQAETYE